MLLFLDADYRRIEALSLGGSWVLQGRVTSRATMVITKFRALLTLLNSH